MRRIAVVTSSRADYGIYRSVLRELEQASGVELLLLVTGTHLSEQHGMTIAEIEADGYSIAARVPMKLESESPEHVAQAMGEVTCGFASCYAQLVPDIVVVLGDRYEMHAAAVATVPFNIPLAHIHGGEVTEGAIDDVFRHSLTKLSHLHFVATEEYARRVQQLGEEPWRVTVSGAPGLDDLQRPGPKSIDRLSATVGMPLTSRGFVLATFHPATREPGTEDEQIGNLIQALGAIGMPVVVTMPNADVGSAKIRRAWQEAAARHPPWRCVESLGKELFGLAMAHAAAMVGNSSSGLIEAPSYGLPVVNIGKRQDGRVRGVNVIDVDCVSAQIETGLQRALNPAFRALCARAINPYGDGRAGQRIAKVLVDARLGSALLSKKFIDA